MNRVACPWCVSATAGEWSERLCPDHLVEYMGVPVAKIERMRAELAEDEWWAHH